MANSRRRSGTNKKGRSNKGGQFVPISYLMAKSDAWRSLSGSAVKVYVELRSRYNGGNNGDLSLSLDEGARLLGLGKATVHRALKELQDKGFVKLTRKGQWYGRRATTFEVTDRPSGQNPPKNEWQYWRKPKSKNGVSVLMPTDEQDEGST